MATIRDTDLLYVQRGETPHNWTGLELKSLVSSAAKDGKLTVGQYLTPNGQQYDGSGNLTINVDGTSEALANKVVVRDASGNFAGNVITASSFSGDGSNLTNTGSTLTEPSTGAQRLVTTNLTSGTMTSSGTTSNLIYDYANKRLKLLDNTQAVFGNSADLKIYHNGSNSFIDDTGAGALILKGNLIRLRATNDENMITASQNGAVQLMYNNGTKLATTSTGVDVTGTLTATTFSGTVSGGDITDGSIPNSALENSTISGKELGTNLATLTSGNYINGNNYNGSAGRTWSVDATSANTASKVVARDSSGNFAAGTITATLSGTATNATNFNVAADNSTDATHYITFTGGATGNQRPNSDTGLTYNPNSNTLTVANLNGNATTATNAGTLDGIDSGSFLRSDANDSASGDLTFNGRVNIRGNIDISDGQKVDFGSSDDVSLYYQASNNWLYCDFKTTGNGIIFKDDGIDKLALEDSGVFRPTTHNTGSLGTDAIEWKNGYFTNLKVTSTLTVRAAIDMADNDVLRFGSSDDFKMFYDGANQMMELEMKADCTQLVITDNTTVKHTFTKTGNYSSTGSITCGSDFTVSGEINMIGDADSHKYLDVRIGDSDYFGIRGTTGGDASHREMARFFRTGAVVLNYNGAAKFLTTSDGAAVNGSQFIVGTGGSAGLTVNDGGGNCNLTFNHAGNKADQDGNAFRISGNTDSSTNAKLDFALYQGIVSGQVGTKSTPLSLTTGGANVSGSLTASGVVTASSFSGDGSSLTGITAGATLSAASGTQRVVLTSLTSGTMTSASTDSGITFAASSNLLTVAGDINSSSDISLKENITSLSDSIGVLKQIEGVRFDWKQNKRTTLGVIAQDVEKVLPELVNPDENGVKSVKYNGLIAVLIEAVKEQQSQIDDLKQQIQSLTK